MDGVRPLRLTWWGQQWLGGDAEGVAGGGTVGCQASAWAVESSASLAVWTCCILYQDSWGSVPLLGKGATLPLLMASPAPSPGALFLGSVS